MPRLPRIVLPDVPMHLTQRGVDRCPTFLDADDFAFYRWALQQAVGDADCAVHAYVLMTNHVHLLLTPMHATGPARLMRSIGRRYVRYFNDRYRRTGTLWEGRFRSTVVDSTPHLSACSRYIEMNPVRAGIVADPGEYAWSSFRHNASGADDVVITPHLQYMSLGRDRDTRCAAYRSLFAADLGMSMITALRAGLRGRPRLYSTTYYHAVQSMLQQSAETAAL